jgi:hypothetical protein
MLGGGNQGARVELAPKGTGPVAERKAIQPPGNRLPLEDGNLEEEKHVLLPGHASKISAIAH